MVFEIIVCVLALYPRYKTVNKQLETINTVVYSLKQSQVQGLTWIGFHTDRSLV